MKFHFAVEFFLAADFMSSGGGTVRIRLEVEIKEIGHTHSHTRTHYK